jgi:hypothetical protein
VTQIMLQIQTVKYLRNKCLEIVGRYIESCCNHENVFQSVHVVHVNGVSQCL